jgi:hypothetical protein
MPGTHARVQARRCVSTDVAWNPLLGGRTALHSGTAEQREAHLQRNTGQSLSAVQQSALWVAGSLDASVGRFISAIIGYGVGSILH